MNRLLLTATLSLTFVAGCDRIDWVEIVKEIERPRPDPVPPTPPPPPPPPVVRDPRCDRGGFGGSIRFDSVETARRALVGRWIHCSRRSLTDLAEDGLEIGPDDRFATLTRGHDGKLIRDVSPDRQGTIVYQEEIDYRKVPADAAIQVDFRTDLGRSVAAFPFLSRDPQALIIDSPASSPFAYIYVPEQ
jgi:hypothetical protein